MRRPPNANASPALLVPPALRASLALAGLFALSACGGSPPDTLGATDGVLAPCPSATDCVHTGMRHPAGTRGLFVRGAVLRLDIIPRIAAVVEEMPGATLVTVEDDYIHAEFRGGARGRVDDLEVLLDPARQAIVRAAPRRSTGSSTVNVERVEDLRQRLEQAGILR